MQKVFELINSLKSGLIELELLVEEAIPREIEVSVNTAEELISAFNDLLSTGGKIICTEGKTYAVNLVNPERLEDAPWITICSGHILKNANQMIPREAVGWMPRLVAKDPLVNLFRNENRARNVAFDHIAFGPQAPDRTVIALGGDRHVLKNPDETPSGYLFKHCVFEGDPQKGQHRFITVNSKDTTIIDSSMWDGFEIGRDSQGIGGWNGTKNLLVQNTSIEAGAENIMFGGDGSASEEMIPQNINLNRVRLAKDKRWSTIPGVTIKCLLEIKNVNNFKANGLLLDNSWRASWPHGWAIVLKSANQGGVEPWAGCSDVDIKNILITDVGSVLSVVSNNDVGHPSKRMRNVKISNLLAMRINQGEFLGTDMMVQLINTPDGLILDHWSVLDNGSSILIGEADRFDKIEPATNKPVITIKNSLFCEGEYGIKYNRGTQGANGKPALDLIVQSEGWEFTANIMGKGPRSVTGISNNVTIPLMEFNALFNAEGKVVKELNQVQSTDGLDIGANVDEIMQAAILQ